jgi:hypothetical protein
MESENHRIVAIETSYDRKKGTYQHALVLSAP